MVAPNASVIRNQPQPWSRGIANIAIARPGNDAFLTATENRHTNPYSDYAQLLRLHGDTRELSMGMVTHNNLLKSKFEDDLFLGNLVVQMYGKCGACSEAHSVLAHMHCHDVFSWTFIISFSSHADQGCDALQYVSQMLHEAILPSSFTYVEILCACSKSNLLIEGQRVHTTILTSSTVFNIVVRNAVLNFYGKCCHLKSAHKVFVDMNEMDAISWNTMLTAYNQHGEHHVSFQFFEAMLQQGYMPNKVTYSCLCDACTSKEDLCKSRRLHTYVVGCGLNNDVDVGNTLISMYARCCSLCDGLLVFDEIREQNVVSWTTLMSALARQKLWKEAVMLSHQMLLQGILPNNVTFVNLISACTSLEDLPSGTRLHAQVISLGCYESNIAIGNALITFYGKCKMLQMARALFDDMPIRDEVSWNSIIAAYFLLHHNSLAWELFEEMHRHDIKVDRVALISIFQSTTSEGDLGKGKLLHAYIYEIWDGLDSMTDSVLVNLYAKCGALEDMQALFDKARDHGLYSWTALISAYGQCGCNDQANQILEHMKLEGCILDGMAFSSVLSVCGGQQGLHQGRRIHACILDCRVSFDSTVSNALLAMYMSCGSFGDVENCFTNLIIKNVVTWNIIIDACVQSGQSKQAFSYFKQMMADEILPNVSTYASILSACTLLTALAEGRWFHEFLSVNGIEPDLVLETALINFYGKCGAVEDALRIFEKMSRRNVAAWNSIIATYCQRGDLERACTLFNQLHNDGIGPDELTFLTVVSSLSHAGLVEEAMHYLVSMARDYRLSPTTEHYNCLIDLFGRAGWLEAIDDMLVQESFKPDLYSWMSLLTACKLHVDVERGERVMKSLFNEQVNNDAPRLLMSNIYAAACLVKE